MNAVDEVQVSFPVPLQLACIIEPMMYFGGTSAMSLLSNFVEPRGARKKEEERPISFSQQ